jgi:hypothetical protein
MTLEVPELDALSEISLRDTGADTSWGDLKVQKVLVAIAKPG